MVTTIFCGFGHDNDRPRKKSSELDREHPRSRLDALTEDPAKVETEAAMSISAVDKEEKIVAPTMTEKTRWHHAIRSRYGRRKKGKWKAVGEVLRSSLVVVECSPWQGGRGSGGGCRQALDGGDGGQRDIAATGDGKEMKKERMESGTITFPSISEGIWSELKEGCFSCSLISMEMAFNSNFNFEGHPNNRIQNIRFQFSNSTLDSQNQQGLIDC